MEGTDTWGTSGTFIYLSGRARFPVSVKTPQDSAPPQSPKIPSVASCYPWLKPNPARPRGLTGCIENSFNMKSRKTLFLTLMVVSGTLTLLVITGRSNKSTALDPSVNYPDHSSTTSGSVANEPGRHDTNSQASQMQTRLALAVERFRDLPFRPEYGDEVFDSSKALSDSDQQKWERHCRLRDTYASEHIRDPAFLKIHDLVNRFNLDDDLVNLSYVYDIAGGLTASEIHATDFSPELVSGARQEELKEFSSESITRYQRILTTIFGQEIDQRFIEALMEINPKGGIGDPNTHVDSGERIILN